MNRIGLVSYGKAGNLYNIQKALEHIGADVSVITRKEEFNNADKLILPGVGNFSDVMSEINKNDLLKALRDEVSSKPTLGICLGMQILSSVGFEGQETEGLGLVQAEVKAMQCHAQIPHMRFNTIQPQKDSVLLRGIEDEEFYFMHSYEMVNYMNILSLTTYAGHTFVSGVEKEMLFGVQFHPEKSRQAGLELFRNFVNI